MTPNQIRFQAEALRRERERLQGRTDEEAVKTGETLDYLKERLHDQAQASQSLPRDERDDEPVRQ